MGAVSPACFGLMTRMLLNVCPKVAIVLEGGYNLKTISTSVCFVAWALLKVPLKIKKKERMSAKYFAAEFKENVLDSQCNRKYAEEYFVFDADGKYELEQMNDVTKTERRR